jgi:hypothetical protein
MKRIYFTTVGVILSCALVYGFGFNGGGSTPVATSTVLGKIKPGIGLQMNADGSGTLDTTGAAIVTGVITFQNVSTAIRSKYAQTGAQVAGDYATNTNLNLKTSLTTFNSYTSSSLTRHNSTVSTISSQAIAIDVRVVKPTSVTQPLNIAVFSNTTGARLSDGSVGIASLEPKMGRVVNGTADNTYGVWTSTSDAVRELRRIDYSQLTSLPALTISTGKSLTINNTLTFNGTDGTTLTFPTVSSSIKPNDAFYGGVYLYENATATTISNANVYHALILAGTGSTQGFTYKAGKATAITIFATDSGGTKTLITAAGHSIATGQPVTIVGTTNYNGTYLAESAGLNTFVIAQAFNAGEVTGGNVRLPVTLRADTGSAGAYRVEINASASSSGNNKVYKVELNKNSAPLDNIVAERNFSTGGAMSPLSSSGFTTISNGDYIWASVANLTDATAITFKHYNINLNRL